MPGASVTVSSVKFGFVPGGKATSAEKKRNKKSTTCFFLLSLSPSLSLSIYVAYV